MNNGGRIVCTATTDAGNSCQNTANGADGVRCTSHQRRGCPPGRVIRPNSAHRTLLRKARTRWRERRGQGIVEGASQLSREYGGGANWWSRVICLERDTPKFLHGPGVQRLVRYLDATVTAEDPHVPEPASGPTLEEVHEEWRKSQEVVSDAEKFSALQANVHDNSARLVKLESMVAEVLQTLTKGV